MTEENQADTVEDANEDSFVDAISAVSLILIAVVIAVYWVAGQ